jgi:hypothetical protein
MQAQLFCLSAGDRWGDEQEAVEEYLAQFSPDQGAYF